MSGTGLMQTLFLNGGVRASAHAQTLDDGSVVAVVDIGEPDAYKTLISVHSRDFDALEQLGNELIRAANLGRGEAATNAQAPAHAAAPVASPGAAVTPRAAAPGEVEAVPQ